MTTSLADRIAGLPRNGRIVILTGAGISKESGIGTYREEGGTWSRQPTRDVASIAGFSRDPDRVHAFHNEHRAMMQQPEIKPNAAHLALARLGHEWQGDVIVVTQNIDDLHEQAGQVNVWHMHGILGRALCMKCGAACEYKGDLDTATACPACGETGGMRPDVVWFGEIPRHLKEIEAALADCVLYCSIGTSGEVSPASHFVMDARRGGALTVELNIAITCRSLQHNEELRGPASVTVPQLVDMLLA